MSNDLSVILSGWVNKDERQSARVINSYAGRPVLQYFESNAVLQMELEGRPDGVRPGNSASMLDLLTARMAHPGATLQPQDWMELDREFVQYQQRRQAALLAAATTLLDGHREDAIALYALAVRDLKHCIDIVDLTVAHHPVGGLVSARPELKPVLIGQRFLALAQIELANEQADSAVELLRQGESAIKEYLESNQPHDEASNACLRELALMESAVRDKYKLKATLQERLDDALAGENYELAATLRDQITRNRSATTLQSDVGP